MAKRWPTFYPFIGLVAAFLLIGGCTRTEEQWYPNYSLYRIAPQNKKIVVFVHGYDGTDESFGNLPYMNAFHKDDITPMYFSYKTDLLFFPGSLDSIGAIADSLREFIHEKVFNRIPGNAGPQEVTIVCHSTGCPIVLSYVAGNPFNHGVKTIITVAGAHYGAEHAETWSKLWTSKLNNKQIFELKYGSMTLFHMQTRLHHLFEKQKREDQQAPELLNTAFEGFQYVINKEVDRVFKEQCFHLSLPEVISVVGRDGFWAFGDEYSDDTIRVESAIPDCRLLKEAPNWIAKLHQTEPRWNDSCDHRFILFLPCNHTSLFSDKKCLDPILALIKYSMSENYPDFKAGEGRLRTIENRLSLKLGYNKANWNSDDFKSYLTGLRMAALWIKVEYPPDAETKDQVTQTKDVSKPIAKVFLSDNEHRKYKKPEYKRESKFLPETIYYYKYPEVPQKQKVSLEISQDGKPLTLRHIISGNDKWNVDTNLEFTINPAQTTMIWCKLHKEPNSQMDCEVITENRNSFYFPAKVIGGEKRSHSAS